MDGSTLSKTEAGSGVPVDAASPGVLSREGLITKVRAYHPRVKSELLGAAYDFAKRHHGTQERDSGEAYYSHPVAVASLLADVRLDEVTIAAGLLHDVVEDVKEIDIGEIEVRFGAEIAELVDGVTKLDKLNFSSREAGEAENFQKFILATTSDIRVLLVKLADRLHNLRTLQFRKKSGSRERTARETMEIYAPLARRVGLYQLAEEMEDLAFRELNPEARRAILFRQEEIALENKDDLERIRGDLLQLMHSAGIACRVKGRKKAPFSIWRKLEKKSISFRDVADIFAFRIIVKDVADCYRVLGEVHTLWACLPERFRDFISVPKPNGYASLHTTVNASGNRRVELQIRTELMDRTAELGVAAHWGYKNSAYGFDADSALAAGLDTKASLDTFAEMMREGSDPAEFMELARLEMYREHVFAFTPQGKLIVLPMGAMPLDFAYAVHSAVGDTCVGARINGEIKPLRRALQNGDRVEIIRGREARAPHGWEVLAMTARARSRLRKLARDREDVEFRRLGEDFLRHALHRNKIETADIKIAQIARQSGFQTADDMYEALGRGDTKTMDIIRTAFPGFEPEPEMETGRRRVDGAISAAMVSGANLTPGVTLHLGPCCCPVPGDRILGVKMPERGIVVHEVSCPQLAAFDETPDLWVDLKWTELAKTGVAAIGRIRINAANERGVLAKLCDVVAQSNGNIVKLATGEHRQDFIEILMEIEVEDLRRLTNILAALRSLSVVDRAWRDQEGLNDR